MKSFSSRFCYLSRSAFFIFIIAHVSVLFSQKHSFRIRKDRPVYFYRMGDNSGPVVAGKSDMFVLLVHDSMKPSVVLDIENGRLENIGRDSVLRLQYLPGMRYEGVFTEKEGKNSVNKDTFISLVNGITSCHRDSVRISVYDKKKETKLMQDQWKIGKE